MAHVFNSSITIGEYKKIMVYSHDSYGLGNIRRMLAICQYLLKSIPNVSILLVSGSPMLQSFRLPKGLDYIKLPCINRSTSGEIAAKYLNTDVNSTLKLRSEIILATAKNYQPDLVLVDKKPSGIQGELDSTINYLKSNLPATKFVLLLRDILDTPQNTIQQWQQEGYYEKVESIYNRVFVVGMPEIFDLSREYQFGSAITAKVRFCGYLRKESGLKNRRTIRQELGIKPDEKLVLVTPGGGEDGYFLINNYLTGLAQNRERYQNEKIRSLIFCGAEMSPEQQYKIHQQAEKYSHVTVLEFTDDLMSYVNTADAVICMCGYNTITEVLQKGKRAIVVPRIKPGQEQLIRAQSLAKAGLIQMIHPEELEPNLLITTLFNSLDQVPHARSITNLNFGGLPTLTNYLAILLFHSLNINRSQYLAIQTA
ncbi:glycosyltransferase family protein [Pleurocapsa sp. PCC 7319]|uniref:glycosyltransferase family protein n=1 Tax=Pleurocapsa sp. PCC 7319 TaxID=118161 RepID=UPI000360F21A|nr:glycosyltransferase [Pleurocapsa sp. PCC 7319]